MPFSGQAQLGSLTRPLNHYRGEEGKGGGKRLPGVCGSVVDEGPAKEFSWEEMHACMHRAKYEREIKQQDSCMHER